MSEYWNRTIAGALKITSGFSGSFSMSRVIGQELNRGRLKRPVVMVMSEDERMELVNSHEVDLAWSIPSINVKWAAEGRGSHSAPLTNIRGVARFPQTDQFMIAVAPWCPISSLEEIAEKKPPLRIGVRVNEGPDYGVFEDAVFSRYGFTLADVDSWGGRNWMVTTRADAVADEIASREVDMVVGEAATQPLWASLARQGFRFLGLRADVVESLVKEEGMDPSTIPAAFLPGITEPLLTVDQSDFLLVAHVDVDADVIYEITRIIDQKRSVIEEGAVRVEYVYSKPLPIPELLIRSPLTGPVRRQWNSPIALHPGAERYYRERGYLD